MTLEDISITKIDF
jgi:N-ethylmaleimide reductase